MERVLGELIGQYGTGKLGMEWLIAKERREEVEVVPAACGMVVDMTG
jgi:hypothetical protein